MLTGNFENFKMKIYFDGSCNPNPNGTAKYAFIIKDESNHFLKKEAGIVCKGYGATNNLAEWTALYFATRQLEYIKPKIVEIFGDSSLVINQLNNNQKTNLKNLRDLCNKTKFSLNGYIWSAEWIPREKNCECHKLLSAYIIV